MECISARGGPSTKRRRSNVVGLMLLNMDCGDVVGVEWAVRISHESWSGQNVIEPLPGTAEPPSEGTGEGVQYEVI